VPAFTLTFVKLLFAKLCIFEVLILVPVLDVFTLKMKLTGKMRVRTGYGNSALLFRKKALF